MNFNFEGYKDKVYACWIGKNIGGTLGAPYEGKQEYLDVKGFTSKKGEPLPNDDLELQLVWLKAVENIGIRNINARVLGEYWLSYIMPHWNEYGICKANMKMGLLPPICGEFNNQWKHSNGAWIRSEIWACLEPCRPDVALSLALEDAFVDHGTGEGTIAAAFVAAMQSAAFCLHTVKECIDVAISKIPADSRVAKTVLCAIDCYNKKKDIFDARNMILKLNSDIGNGWFESPSNVGYAVLGLLYGEGDFKKSILYAINCGDDTDCTGATVGSTLGILGGTKAIPQDWREYIGDDIITICIDKTTCSNIPKTCNELTERVAALCKESVKYNIDYLRAWASVPVEVVFTDNASEIETNIYEKLKNCPLGYDVLNLKCKPYTVSTDFCVAKASLSVIDGDIVVSKNSTKKLAVRVETNEQTVGNVPLNVSLRWWLPEGFTIEGKNNFYIPAFRLGDMWHDHVEEYVLKCGDNVKDTNRIVVEITVSGRPDCGYLQMLLLS